MGSLPEKSKMHPISLSIVDSLFLSVAQNHHHLPLIANKVSSNVQLLSSFFENLQLLSWRDNRQDYYEIKLIIVVSLRLSFLFFSCLQNVAITFEAETAPELRIRGQLCYWLCAMTSAFDFAAT